MEAIMCRYAVRRLAYAGTRAVRSVLSFSMVEATARLKFELAATFLHVPLWYRASHAVRRHSHRGFIRDLGCHLAIDYFGQVGVDEGRPCNLVSRRKVDFLIPALEVTWAI